MIKNLSTDGITIAYNEDEGEDILNMKNVTYNLVFPDKAKFCRSTGGKLIDVIKMHIKGNDKIAKKIKEFKGVKVTVENTWCTATPLKL